MKKFSWIMVIMLFFFAGVASADYYYHPMNFYSPTWHEFEMNVSGDINVTIPTGFSMISGNNTGNGSIYMILQSPNLGATDAQLFEGEIYVNGSLYDTYYFIYIDPTNIVDNKLEVGHGDFNYINTGEYIGTDNTMLFSLVRVWGIGTNVLDEDAYNVTFDCTYPFIIPNTADSKYNLTYNISNEITATGWLDRLRGNSMFRLFVLSQEVDQNFNTTYFVDCDELTYHFENTRIVAPIPDFNIYVRSLEPITISMMNKSEYITYSFLNDELYDIKDVEFLFSIGTDTIRKEVDYLDAGEIVQFDIPTNESGTVDLKVSFIPQWMFNSRSPTHYEQTQFDTYYTPEFLGGLNTSAYYANQSPKTSPILETQQMDFSISILQDAPFGGAYKVTYLFYDGGVLVESVARQIVGVQDHLISFSSTALDPAGLEEDYDVYTIVSVYDENGDWYDFPQEFIGIQTVASLTDNGPQSQIGYYDVVVTNRADRYEEDDRITADILIKNTGDTPDEDTILTYYLVGPDGEIFGETKEQILEVPVGDTVLTRSITLPALANKGEWEFHAEYETVVQPTIDVYDSFEVVTGLTILEKVQNGVTDFSRFGWSLIWLGLFLLFLFLLLLIGRRKRKEVK